jgi:pimeloyl-ACP methyl ester carboxylesterase
MVYATLPNGIRVFYREAGSPSNPTFLLLHGFPTSSHQFRKIIPLLASKYHVVAPDLPGYGFTEIPSELNFEYSFANIATTIGSFLDVLKIKKFGVYIFDYGAPTGLRLALERPGAIWAIVAQNGNAYVEGLSEFWDPVKAYWATAKGSPEEKEYRRLLTDAVLGLEPFRQQYVYGEPEAEKIDDPAAYYLDWALVSRPGNLEIQLDLLKSYATNVDLYPKFQEYFRQSQVPLLAVWGKNDLIFPAPGAEAYKKDLPNAKIVLLDGGHFLVESHTEEVANHILDFFTENSL